MSKQWWLGFAGVNIIIITLFFGCGFSSCYTPKKAEKQVLKAAAVHPEVVSRIAARLYPPKDSTVFRDIINFDTLYMPEYTISDTVYSHDTVVITHRVEIPKTVVKTLTQTKEVYRENTARVENMAHQIDGLTKGISMLEVEVGVLKDKLKTSQSKNNKKTFIISGLVLAILGYLFLKLKKIL